MNIHKNLSLKDALKSAEQLGCSVYKNKQNEWVVVPSDGSRRERISQKRHDATRKLITLLRRLEKGDQSVEQAIPVNSNHDLKKTSFLTVKEAASRLDCHESFITRCIKQGRINADKQRSNDNPRGYTWWIPEGELSKIHINREKQSQLRKIKKRKISGPIHLSTVQKIDDSQSIDMAKKAIQSILEARQYHQEKLREIDKLLNDMMETVTGGNDPK